MRQQLATGVCVTTQLVVADKQGQDFEATQTVVADMYEGDGDEMPTAPAQVVVEVDTPWTVGVKLVLLLAQEVVAYW